MRFEVLLTEDAAPGLEETHDYVGDGIEPRPVLSRVEGAAREGWRACGSNEHDDPANAVHVLERLETAIEDLAENPKRGSCPKELLALCIREYRQTFFKPCRMIHQTAGRRVHVYFIADSRRHTQTLRARRLFGA